MAKFRLINTQDDVIFRLTARDAQQMQGTVTARSNGNWTDLPPEPTNDASVKEWRLQPTPSLYLTLGEVLIVTGDPSEAGYDRSVIQAGQMLGTRSKNPILISGPTTGGIFIGRPEFIEIVGP